ncbi:circularly permuted type 2 ATP-grasp protein [Sulfurimonas sp.]|uniref:circularly permuted type 2 ATP-grasp protein n=1 Tax=Sulfurimonas sp. TaxID=2022749 RepID=UPI0025D7984C|nr:circularly permuted type 2 ATP-grasp protein [Sulfurimonas sp.]MDD5157113.1 circularly permuted type 2 ATP-grasp protein [Sulfurimonas sp.]
MALFDSYISESSFDELFDSNRNIRDYWKNILEALESAGLETLNKKQADIDWHLQDNGVTYNIYGNDNITNRSWSLDPIPFVISEGEWEQIKKGLVQRAKLLNLILKDIYSEQKLIKDGIIPAEIIYTDKGYATEVFNLGERDDFNLYFYATDIARGPDGKMWVIGDKTQAPSGLGYAIENRLTMNIISKELYPNINTKKLFHFIDEFKELIKNLTNGDTSSAAILTPGPYNETYFEHAYLSSFLEINLVQGDDLLSKNGALWLKSLGGLKKIDTLLRRVDDRFCDPLELNSSSKLGVAGFIESIRQNNLRVINPIGSAILENRELNPFMNKIAEYFLQEELILPQVATWWCGQKEELKFVLKNLNLLIIKKIDTTQESVVYFGKDLTKKELLSLAKLIRQNPSKYIAQEEISFSTTPYYGNGKIEPRNALIRTFCLKNSDSYSVMDGGLVRVSHVENAPLVSSQKGGTSKDLWILSSKDEIEYQDDASRHTKYIVTAIENISTLRAENLFWLGRYLSRAIYTTRFIIFIVKKLTNLYRYEISNSKKAQDILQKALTHLTMTYPGFLDEDKIDIDPMVEILSVIKNSSYSGSLSSIIYMLSNSNISLKDLLAIESTKLLENIQRELGQFIPKTDSTSIEVANDLDKLLIYLIAYKELVRDSIFKEQGLILYDIGYNIECTLVLISKARSMLCLRLSKSVTYDILEAMLNSMESMNAYRAQYKSSLMLESVVEFLVLNRQFPKSIAHMADRLAEDFKLLPKSKNYLTNYEKPINQARIFLEQLNIKDMMAMDDDGAVYMKLDSALSELSNYFSECSNEFTKTYFSHYDE